MFNLTGRFALVTGASGGIGGAVAKALADAGAKVALSGTRVEALEAAQKDIPNSIILPCNLSDAAATAGLVGQAEEALGGLDILVSNAGLTKDGLLMRMKDEDWDAVIDTNLKAVFRASRAAIRPMMKQRYGRIVNITSVVGASGNAGQANYAAAKAGVAGMTRALARELGSRGVTVNCVAPGFIDTDMTHSLPEAQKAALLAQIPLGRLGQAEEIAHAVAFLASPGAGYVTGTELHVNGGMYMA